ncbi:TRAP transporter small permease subunit [Streptomyces sp. DSM 42041]|uniref:TRAP transporter small permease subunit n=1 Tax=Streptomyces hazeniae TaxID=3075538 RepID=A0ABU2NWH8_9ACTN|nr:TRAP transporter small permease subunit [Streptomyces sp. DSM 42041]MDT0381094.1 TRAP transporter small permease subunit [Streptomyces sp. DSM 42041]
MAGRESPRRGGRAALDGIHHIAANLAGAVLILITLIVLAGVGSRLFFGQPLPAANDLIGSCLMVALTYLALSSSLPIRITVVTRRLPKRVARGVDGCVVAVCATGVALAVWAALAIAVNAFRTGESTVGLYTFDIAPFRFLIVVGLLLLLLRIVRSGGAWLAGEGEDEDEEATDGTSSGAPAGTGDAGAYPRGGAAPDGRSGSSPLTADSPKDG